MIRPEPLVFHAVHEPEPGPALREHFERHWPGYEQWFLQEGERRRPTYARCVRALREHMPELLPIYRNICDAVGAGDRAARFLSLYCPAPFLSGCSQAIWSRGEPVLVRNYDYAPALCDRLLLQSAWRGHPVMAMTDCLWGALDGMNRHGLALALAFGGRRSVGKGFGIPIILRYILETCRRTGQAAETLQRIPSHMAYNISIVDAKGEHATVFLGPDRETVVTDQQACANHQESIAWPEHAALTETRQRESLLLARLADPEESFERFLGRFLSPPLYQNRLPARWQTLYTAAYFPERRGAQFIWPSETWTPSFEHFPPRTYRFQPPAASGYRPESGTMLGP